MHSVTKTARISERLNGEASHYCSHDCLLNFNFLHIQGRIPVSDGIGSILSTSRPYAVDRAREGGPLHICMPIKIMLILLRALLASCTLLSIVFHRPTRVPLQLRQNLEYQEHTLLFPETGQPSQSENKYPG